jgi:4-amino-4-deoxy-L-arabinose transferase-like glycosyltransferase
VLVLAAVVRLLWVAYAVRAPQFGDPMAYLYYGEEIAAGRGYRSIAVSLIERARFLDDPNYVAQDIPATAFYPIGYPAMVAAVAWVQQHTPVPGDLVTGVAVVQACLGVATVAMVHAVTRRLFDPSVALVAAIVVALFPALVFYTSAAFTETLFIFFVVAVVLAFVWHPWDRGRMSWPNLAVAGLLLGASAQVRPFLLPVVPGLALLWLLHGAGWRRALAQTGVLVVAVVLVLTPWTIRNYRAVGAVVPISTNLGDTICISRTPGALGGSTTGGHDPSGCRWALGNDEEGDEHFEVRNNRENLHRAWRFVREHPGEELSLQAERLFYTFAGSSQILDHGQERVAGDEEWDPVLSRFWRDVLGTFSDAYFFVVGAVAILGARLFWKGDEPRRGLVLVAAVTLIAIIPLMLYGIERFQMPVLPLLAVLAAPVLHGAVRAACIRPRADARVSPRASAAGDRDRSRSAESGG